MSDTDDIQKLKSDFEQFVKAKFNPLSTKFDTVNSTVDILNGERSDNAKIKWTQKLVDDLADQLSKRIKLLEDKVTALQKKK
jgi:hypothetical protein